ncbi:MAG TPA: hypothetical protein DCR58_02055 [Idiomarina baltica]|uniref:Uncharacterized protein n=2 Tax=Alteromonadales TaxID=135622 RepID=A0A358E074_9ALTE|nr:hypothetical protein [Alteromonas australica]HAR55550.1 hypothetical protein [Idiomarina baltica]HBU51345.1 hypothetical protein [Alteromonas australica]
MSGRVTATLMAMLRRCENRYPRFYDIVGMPNIRRLRPRARLSFWLGAGRILGVGYLAAMFTSGNVCVLVLLAMNVLLGWWCYKWKHYLATLD